MQRSNKTKELQWIAHRQCSMFIGPLMIFYFSLCFAEEERAFKALSRFRCTGKQGAEQRLLLLGAKSYVLLIHQQ
jgi:hypothetical protein